MLEVVLIMKKQHPHKRARKICIAARGLNEEELAEHMEAVHHICLLLELVRQKNKQRSVF